MCDRYAELSLDGWDAANGGGGVALPNRDRGQEGEGRGEGGGRGGEVETTPGVATAPIVAKMELVESGLPGGDAVDVTVSSNDREVRTVNRQRR